MSTESSCNAGKPKSANISPYAYPYIILHKDLLPLKLIIWETDTKRAINHAHYIFKKSNKLLKYEDFLIDEIIDIPYPIEYYQGLYMFTESTSDIFDVVTSLTKMNYKK